MRTESAESEPKASKPRTRRERDEEPRRSVSTADVSTKRIYLGNLSYEVTESDLEELFRGVGTVRRVEIVYNRQTHRSKGYGFVEMLDVDEAKRAVEILHDQFFMGRKLNVSGANSSGPADLEDTPKEVQPKAEEMVVESPKAEAPATEEAPVEVTGDPEAAATEETGDATEEAPKATGQ